VTGIAVTCVTNTYTVGVTVTGLAGTGLVLRNNGGDNLPITGNTPFTFATRVASGGAYAVTVLTSPSSPSQTCTPTSGSGTVGAANVVVAVTCVTNTYTVGVTVTGLAGTGLVLQNNGGDNLPITGNTPFTFATRVASGGAYAVTVLTAPSSPAQTCTPASGSGTVGSANVVVAVTCVTNGYTVGGTVTGLDGSGLVLRNNGGNDLTISASGSFAFTTPLASGALYAVTIQTQPTNPAQVCTLSNDTGTMAAANVTNVSVSCPPVVVVQKWHAPTAWGGTTSFWPDNDPMMVEHTSFSPSGTVDTRLSWGTPSPLPPFQALAGVGSPAMTRYGAGPFSAPYVATAGDTALDITGDMLACAVVKPAWNPGDLMADDRIIMAKGIRGGSGWMLMQMHFSFCFHYQGLAAGELMAFANTEFSMPSYVPPPPPPPTNLDYHGPLNPTYVVVCGGRDVAGGKIVAVANGWDSSLETAISPSDSMVISTSPASLGGYAVSDAGHNYPGRIYETAVWAIPATRANIEAKMAHVLGLFMPNGTTAARYTRDREGYYQGADVAGSYHTAWKHQPRIDPAGKGFLFGLQATNRVPYPEALQLWAVTPASGPTAPTVTANDAMPPGDADVGNATRILLPAGSNISVLLDAFGNPGSVHGQIWLRGVGATPSGTLTIASAIPSAAPPTDLGSQNVPLTGMTAWTNVQITGLTALPATGRGTLYLRNDTATPIEFHAWGVTLTQLGRDIAGVTGDVLPLGFDPGPTIYNSLANTSYREVLLLPTIASSTAGLGFCVGADGRPPDGMPWQGPFFDRRTLVEWANASVTDTAKLMVLGTAGLHDLEFLVRGSATGVVRVTMPGALATNTSARIKGCVAANGTMTLYVDDVSVGTSTLATGTTPDISGGSLAVGSDHTGTEPWQGYVKAAVACRNPGVVADCQ
jgi:hypothetical protein